MKELHEALQKTVKRTLNGLAHSLAEATPVKTGFASANWHVAGLANIPPRADPTAAASNAEVAAAKLSQAASLSAFNNSPFTGDSVSLVNNASYIVELENGSSKQAPSGFVLQAIARIKT